jgi:hypothetical protein
MSGNRKITYLPLAELKPDPRNAKKHSTDLIDESMNRHGLVDTITRDDRTGFIISGHGRAETLQAKEKKGDPVPDGVIVGSDGRWLVPVVTGWESSNDAEAAAALIGMNRLTEVGGWADDAVLALLDELSAAGAGFAGVGYDDSDADDLRVMLEDQAQFDLSAAAERLKTGGGLDGTTDPGAGDDPDSEAPSGGIGPGAGAAPGTPGNSDLYSEQGRRLIVLDYSVEEFATVAPRIKKLRDLYSVDSNAEAVRLHVLALYSDADLLPVDIAAVAAAPADDYAEVEVSQSTAGDERPSASPSVAVN